MTRRRPSSGPVWSGLGGERTADTHRRRRPFLFGETRIAHSRSRRHDQLHSRISAFRRIRISYGPRVRNAYLSSEEHRFALQTILPHAAAARKNVTMKLVSELTPADLRDYDVIYVGFVRAMAILKDYYFSRSNFSSDAPLYMSLARPASGEVFTRSGPVPQHNRDYGVFARFTGPAGNQIVVFAGIGDVGVSAVVRSLAVTPASSGRGAAAQRSARVAARSRGARRSRRSQQDGSRRPNGRGLRAARGSPAAH